MNTQFCKGQKVIFINGDDYAGDSFKIGKTYTVGKVGRSILMLDEFPEKRMSKYRFKIDEGIKLPFLNLELVKSVVYRGAKFTPETVVLTDNPAVIKIAGEIEVSLFSSSVSIIYENLPKNTIVLIPNSTLSLRKKFLDDGGKVKELYPFNVEMTEEEFIANNYKMCKILKYIYSPMRGIKMDLSYPSKGKGRAAKGLSSSYLRDSLVIKYGSLKNTVIVKGDVVRVPKLGVRGEVTNIIKVSSGKYCEVKVEDGRKPLYIKDKNLKKIIDEKEVQK